MDVKEAEERTKIRARYLRALEAEDWEVLPAPAYVRGFPRTYGDMLDLDGEMLADRYRRFSEDSQGGASSPATEPLLRERLPAASRSPPSRTPVILAIAAGIIILLVILGSIGGDDDGDKSSGDGDKAARKLRRDDEKKPQPLRADRPRAGDEGLGSRSAWSGAPTSPDRRADARRRDGGELLRLQALPARSA